MSDYDLSQPLERAHLALTGLAIGDAIGGFFEFSSGRISRYITNRKLPNGIWHWTDDTQMALSIFAVLRQCANMNQDLFAASLVNRYEKSRGYGMTTRAVLRRIHQNKSWRESSDSVFGGEGSFGNGAASRVPPLGAFFADDLAKVVNQATLSAAVTHSHPESIAGTIAVAVATSISWSLRLETGISRKSFLERVIAHVPDSIVREKLVLACNLDDDISVHEAATTLGNGSQATVQTTVPFALWCASDFGNSYSDAIWKALEGQGDSDTVCAIVGGVVAVRVEDNEISATWKESCEPLPQWIFNELIHSLTENLT
jgi:ADP-ribosylglycohydrolase